MRCAIRRNPLPAHRQHPATLFDMRPRYLFILHVELNAVSDGEILLLCLIMDTLATHRESSLALATLAVQPFAPSADAYPPPPSA
jgi:hypothetical protein